VPRAGHKKGVIPQQPRGIKQGEEQQPPPNTKGHIPEEHKPNGQTANGHIAKGHIANGHIANGQIANGHIAKGQQPRHGIRHKHGEHNVKNVNPPLIANKGNEHGIKHKHKGLKQNQSIQIRGGHMHSQQAPIK